MAPAEGVDLSIDYYELLSIPATATESEIRRAYRKTSLLYHPDKVTPTDETSAKFQLLQVALNVLTDVTQKAKYDQTREAKLRRVAENEALEGRRRKMKEDLERRESGTNGAMNGVNQVSGMKRTWSDREIAINKIAEENKKRRETMMQERAKKSYAAEASAKPVADKEKPSDAMERSIKIRWLKEGDGLDIDEDWIREGCQRYGEVENILLLKDRKRKVDGREKKVVTGTALIVFASLLAAKKVVAGGAWSGTESIIWATEKENEPS